MTARGDGPWDPPTEHDDHTEVGDMSGEDPPTMRASDVQRARARSAAVANQLATAGAPATASKPAPTTLPPPVVNRTPARAVPSAAPPPAPLVAPRTRPPTSRPAADDVVVLDRVAASMPAEHAPRRSESSAGGIVVVATGGDAERVRRLCHQHGLLVPVMTSLAAVHDAMSIVVIGEPSPPAPERVVHVVRPALPDDQLLALLRALVSGHTIAEPPRPSLGASSRVTDAARRLATLTDRGAIEMTTIEAITALTAADRAHCLFHDPVTGALWSEAKRRNGGDDRHAMGGLVGWAARTGETILASPAGDDPRWLQELDDPAGKPQSRVLVQPIIGTDRRVHAVLVAVRRWRHTDFTAAEREALASFAALAGPALDLAVAASPADARKVRTTMAGVASSAVPAKRPAPHILPITDEPTKIDAPTYADDAADDDAARDDGRYSSESITSLPSPPVGVKPSVSWPAMPAMDDEAAAATPSRPTPRPAERRSAPRSVAPPVVMPPPAPRAPLADGSVEMRPDDADSNASFAPDPRPRTSTASQLPSARRRLGTASESPFILRRTGELRDLAVIANKDDARRVHRIATKLRLELLTFADISEAPPYYDVLTLGDTFTGADPRLVHAVRSGIADDQLGDLLGSLIHDRAVAPAAPPTKPQSAAEARRSQLAFAGARKLATAGDLAAAETIATTTIVELLDTDRAYCLFVDPSTGALWSEARRRAGGDDRRALAGIAGWAARTGRTANVPRASADPRWLAPLDDPDGDPNSQLLVQPLVRLDERVHAIFIAARRARRPGFTDTDAALLARFASLATPLLEQIALAAESRQLLGDDTAGRAAQGDDAGAPSRSGHPHARWLYAALGAVLGLIIGLLV